MKKNVLMFFIAMMIAPSAAFAAYGLTQSATLNGTSQDFSVADNAALRVTNGWTVEMSIKPNMASAAGDTEVAFSRSGENCWGIRLVNTSGSTYVVAAQTGAGSCDDILKGSINVNDGNWHFIRVFYNNASCTISVDGTTDVSGSCGSISNPSATIFFGANVSSGGTATPNYKGSLSLMRIWNNQHTIADQCTFYGTATPNMNAEWSLNNVLTDTSGNGNTLTNNGSITFAASVPASCVTVTPAFVNQWDVTWWMR